MNRLFTYTIPVDDGAAPNPFHNMCTLAICKPAIRRVAKEGDWVVGLGSKNAPSGRDLSGKVVYAMLVDEVVPMEKYDQMAAEKWPHRVPNFNSGDPKDRLGDCIYDYSAGEPPSQRFGVHGPENVGKDLRGKNVLIADEFYYFGSNPVRLPSDPDLQSIVHQGQGHKSNANDPYLDKFVAWIKRQKRGLQGVPDRQIDWTVHVRGCSCESRAKDPDDEPIC